MGLQKLKRQVSRLAKGLDCAIEDMERSAALGGRDADLLARVEALEERIDEKNPVDEYGDPVKSEELVALEHKARERQKELDTLFGKGVSVVSICNREIDRLTKALTDAESRLGGVDTRSSHDAVALVEMQAQLREKDALIAKLEAKIAGEPEPLDPFAVVEPAAPSPIEFALVEDEERYRAARDAVEIPPPTRRARI